VKLSAIVINWNAIRDTQRTVAMVASWCSNASDVTIWVVDNASSEPGVDALKRESPEVHFIHSSVNLGFGGANNLAIAAACEHGSDAVLMLNNDAAMDASSVAAMVAALESDPRIGVVGPVLWHKDHLISVGGRDIARHGATHMRSPWPVRGLLDVDYVSGTAALVHRRTFESVGLLDEDYFFAGEMADLCFRARGAGLRCVTASQAKAFHDLDRSSSLRETLHPYYIFRNRFLYITKHYGRNKARLFLAWTARSSFAAAAALARGNRPRARAIALGLIDGLKGRFGGRNERILN
jgi:hypothetical protein